MQAVGMFVSSTGFPDSQRKLQLDTSKCVLRTREREKDRGCHFCKSRAAAPVT